MLYSGPFESQPFARGIPGRSVSMRLPSKTKDTLSKVFPLRWSFGSKDRRKPEPVPPPVQDTAPVELVQYLESGRRPRCTKEPIVSLMSESRSTKKVAEGNAASAVRSDKAKDGPLPESPQVPEGQRRPFDKTGIRISRGGQGREEGAVNINSSSSSNTLTRRKDTTKPGSSNASHDTDTKRSLSCGVQPSYSSPSLHDASLRRQKGERADRERHGASEANCNTKRGDVPKSHEGLLSFFKGNFLKKEKDPKKSRETESDRGRGGERGGVGVEGEGGSKRTLSRLSLSNGSAVGRAGVEGVRSSRSGHLSNELTNGKVGHTAAEIKRSQSSSNIPTKAEHSVSRTASLHRNGKSAASHSLAADKPLHGTLQRTRYSTASLGRKRTVPESSF